MLVSWVKVLFISIILSCLFDPPQPPPYADIPALYTTSPDVFTSMTFTPKHKKRNAVAVKCHAKSKECIVMTRKMTSDFCRVIHTPFVETRLKAAAYCSELVIQPEIVGMTYSSLCALCALQ